MSTVDVNFDIVCISFVSTPTLRTYWDGAGLKGRRAQGARLLAKVPSSQGGRARFSLPHGF
jgi:hypothetical protein